jgi:hypothetical protein
MHAGARPRDQSAIGAGDADVVLIAGKGHETYQEISGCRLPFQMQRRPAPRSRSGEAMMVCMRPPLRWAAALSVDVPFDGISTTRER